MSRYARQEILPNIGNQGQAKLAAAHVLVVGAGGLGSPALQYLVGAGIGHITIVDPDVVDMGNLHRQTLFREADVGQPKSEMAKSHLGGLNADCNITARTAFLDPDLAADLVPNFDVVLDCADSFAASYILSDLCHTHRIPFITASVLGTAGYAGGFCGTAPSLRAVFPDLPNRAATCATAGVMGPVVGMIGALQAQMCLAQILGHAPSPLGQMVTLDMGTYRQSGFRFDTAPEPTGPQLHFISPAQIRATDHVIELRDKSEAPTPIHPRALRATAGHVPAPARGQRTILACRSGLRAWNAARQLAPHGGEVFLIASGDASQTTPNPKKVTL